MSLGPLASFLLASFVSYIYKEKNFSFHCREFSFFTAYLYILYPYVSMIQAVNDSLIADISVWQPSFIIIRMFNLSKCSYVLKCGSQ